MDINTAFPNKEKTKELILYMCKQSEDDKKFGSTKLNKQLFFSDFFAYRIFGKPITGQRYQKLARGPVLCCMLPLAAEMKANNELDIIPRNYEGYTQHEHKALRNPNTGLFSSKEKRVVDKVIEILKPLNATECSEISHGFFWWDLFGNGEDIDYSLALVGLPDSMTEEEQEYAHSLEGMAQAWLTKGIK